MKILMVSGVLSNRVQTELFEQKVSYGFAVQKFFQLYLEGCKDNNIEVETLSMIPMTLKKSPYIFKYFKSDEEDGIRYNYVPFIRNTIIYHIFVFFYVFLFVFYWSFKNRKDSYICYDVLISNRCLATIAASILGGKKTIAIVTDMPGMFSEKQVHYDEMGVIGKLQMKSIYHSSAFVFLTEQTNDVLNPFNHPYIIIEGLVSRRVKVSKIIKNKTRDILYAGGVVESYGLGMLCDAFMRITDDNLRLVIYGNGSYVQKIKDLARQDRRIEYRGIAKNEVIVDAEQRATLLVNPRFTGADYTLYSFPSKNIEYMVSGTPILTTKLAGIPKDYTPYIFTFEEETVEEFEKTIRRVLLNTNEELMEFGLRAQKYILENKNSTIQMGKLKKMIKSL